jgi:hypothetical protein
MMDQTPQTIAAAAPDGTSAKSVPAPGHEWWRKPLRTAIQIIMGGGLSLLLDWIAHNLGGTVTAGELGVLALIFTQLTSMAQNYGESRGWIPTTIIQAAPRLTAVTTMQAPVEIVPGGVAEDAPSISAPPAKPDADAPPLTGPAPERFAANRSGPAPTASPADFSQDPAATL